MQQTSMSFLYLYLSKQCIVIQGMQGKRIWNRDNYAIIVQYDIKAIPEIWILIGNIQVKTKNKIVI